MRTRVVSLPLRVPRRLVSDHPDAEDEFEALVELFRKFADQRVSFTDCVSFALMRRYGIAKAFGFDRHFVHAGFELWPEP